ncbi:hypothetical protein JKP88DRAFT_262608 [Tribonema minus]|uniref:Steroid 5-alpha reductase C-terminal domain-containing protein n=1 Tax=Tribonema minus TaxID=303371 RepID=A0A835Z1P4_9STRA|nr:hypothetical protein JKP88DRAFT_262608 [Tribonema minus]
MQTAVRQIVKSPSVLMALKNSSPNGLLFSAAIIGGINLLGFSITAATKTHKLTDLFGTGAFVASAAASAYVNGVHAHPWSRPFILSAAVSIWGIRLAGHLFERILTSPKDPRLEKFMPKKGEKWLDSSGSNFPLNLAGFWMIQAAWAWVVSLPVTMANFNPVASTQRLGMGGRVALLTFAGGFAFEAIADWQKRSFKKNPANKGKWIDQGVWSVSRHPNYFGELLIWSSLFFASVPALRGPRQVLIGAVSPLFISGLILYVSGIPLLEDKMNKDHGQDEKYLKYKETTPLLVPYCKWLRIPGLPY